MSLWTLFKVGGLTLMVREQFAKTVSSLKGCIGSNPVSSALK